MSPPAVMPPDPPPYRNRTVRLLREGAVRFESDITGPGGAGVLDRLGLPSDTHVIGRSGSPGRPRDLVYLRSESFPPSSAPVTPTVDLGMAGADCREAWLSYGLDLADGGPDR